MDANRWHRCNQPVWSSGPPVPKRGARTTHSPRLRPEFLSRRRYRKRTHQESPNGYRQRRVAFPPPVGTLRPNVVPPSCRWMGRSNQRPRLPRQSTMRACRHVIPSAWLAPSLHEEAKPKKPRALCKGADGIRHARGRAPRTCKVSYSASSPIPGDPMANIPMYHDGSRQLQDRFETHDLADRLAQVLARAAFTEDDRLF